MAPGRSRPNGTAHFNHRPPTTHVRHRRIRERRNDGQAADRGIVERMTATLAHRGPDGDGLLLSTARSALGHRRLSIIDVAGGAQPMSNEDGTVWVTYNGELYNEPELRRELEAQGASLPDRRATPRAWSTSTKRRGRISSAGSTACSRWRSGTAAAAGWSWRATGWVRSRSSTASCRAAASPSARSRRRSWRIPRSAASSIAGGLARYLFYEYVPAPYSIWRSLRKLPRGHVLVWEAGAVRVDPVLGRRRRRSSPPRGLRGGGRAVLGRVPRRRGAAPAVGRAARRLPLGRRRFLERRRGALRGRAGAERAHVLDRLRGPELRRERARPRGGPASGDRPPRADLLGRDGLRALARGRGLARRAVRRRVDPADAPAEPVRAGAR